MNACTGAGGRGCQCAWHAKRRVYGTEYARQQRERAFVARQSGELRCVRRYGAQACGMRLELTTDGNGATIVAPCSRCARFFRGLCADCPAPVDGTVGKARRCAPCKHRANLESAERHAAAHHDEKLAAARRSYQENEDRRRARNEYKRAYRKAHPDKVREYKRLYVERHRDDPDSAYNRYQRRYRKRHAGYYRELENQKNVERREERGVPPCRSCGKATGWTLGRTGRPYVQCIKCLPFKGERKARRRREREIAKLIAADPNFGLPPKPVRVVKPRLVAKRGPGRERLCITDGCDIVLTGRKKKCTKCRQREAEIAAEKLTTMHQGRGRRTDLEHRAVA